MGNNFDIGQHVIVRDDCSNIKLRGCKGFIDSKCTNDDYDYDVFLENYMGGMLMGFKKEELKIEHNMHIWKASNLLLIELRQYYDCYVGYNKQDQKIHVWFKGVPKKPPIKKYYGYDIEYSFGVGEITQQ